MTWLLPFTMGMFRDTYCIHTDTFNIVISKPGQIQPMKNAPVLLNWDPFDNLAYLMLD